MPRHNTRRLLTFVAPNNPINTRAFSLDPRLSLFSEVGYSLSQQFDFLCFLRFGLFFAVVLLAFASKVASFLCDLDSSYGTQLETIMLSFI